MSKPVIKPVHLKQNQCLFQHMHVSDFQCSIRKCKNVPKRLHWWSSSGTFFTVIWTWQVLDPSWLKKWSITLVTDKTTLHFLLNILNSQISAFFTYFSHNYVLEHNGRSCIFEILRSNISNEVEYHLLTSFGTMRPGIEPMTFWHSTPRPRSLSNIIFILIF